MASREYVLAAQLCPKPAWSGPGQDPWGPSQPVLSAEPASPRLLLGCAARVPRVALLQAPSPWSQVQPPCRLSVSSEELNWSLHLVLLAFHTRDVKSVLKTHVLVLLLPGAAVPCGKGLWRCREPGFPSRSLLAADARPVTGRGRIEGSGLGVGVPADRCGVEPTIGGAWGHSRAVAVGAWWLLWKDTQPRRLAQQCPMWLLAQDPGCCLFPFSVLLEQSGGAW